MNRKEIEERIAFLDLFLSEYASHLSNESMRMLGVAKDTLAWVLTLEGKKREKETEIEEIRKDVKEGK